jgi:predicted Zn-dependent protease
MLTKEQAQKIIAQTLSYSTYPECDVTLNSTETDFIRFALNGVTTSGFVVQQNMSISSTRDGKTGSTTVDEFTEDALREAVRRTESLAAISPANPERLPDIGPQKYPVLENYSDGTASARNPVMVPAIRTIIDGAKTKNLVAAGFFERIAESSSVGNKNGNFGFGRTTQAYLSTTVRDASGTSSGWASQPAVNIEDISGDAIAKAAIEKCETWKNPRRLDPGKYTVVLEPTAVGDLVQLMGFAMQARSAEEGRSFLSKRGGGTRVGETMFPEFITLRTDPFHKLYSVLPWGGGGGGFGFGGGGGGGAAAAVPTDRIAWIESGVVKNLVYDRYWANKAGKPSTPAPSHLVLDGATKSLADQIASVDRGLLVTRFWYIRSLNPQTVQLTGLTRDGLFLIENGKVSQPVVNFRFNESPVRVLQNALALGEPIRVRGGEGQGMIAPPMTVKDFNFSSVSDAV